MANRTLKFVTGNINKFNEVALLLAPIKLKQVNINLDEIQGLDPHKIIAHKLQEALKHEKGEFIIEDDSLYLDCLDSKLPGPLIKWFNDTIGNKGMVKMVKGMGNNKAWVESIFGYAKNSRNIKFFRASLDGSIVPARGTYGFAYDPIFMPKGFNKTFAQMKNKGRLQISSRGIAADKLKKYLLKYG